MSRVQWQFYKKIINKKEIEKKAKNIELPNLNCMDSHVSTLPETKQNNWQTFKLCYETWMLLPQTAQNVVFIPAVIEGEPFAFG